MEDILNKIVAHKRIEVDQQKQVVLPETLHKRVDSCLLNDDTKPLSMYDALIKSKSGIIAEFKRRSPSKGWIHPDADIDQVVISYERGGASAISILTDEEFFGGQMRYVSKVRPSVTIPILRKDFIIDEYQVFQSRLIGANAILLIAACLKKEECRLLARRAHELGLETLLELHDEQELEYVCDDVDMVGVNNRHLGTFHTDVEHSFRLASQLPTEKLLVSESGIDDADIVCQLREVGFRGFLIGETFMRCEQPGEALRQFVAAITNH